MIVSKNNLFQELFKKKKNLGKKETVGSPEKWREKEDAR